MGRTCARQSCCRKQVRSVPSSYSCFAGGTANYATGLPLCLGMLRLRNRPRSTQDLQEEKSWPRSLPRTACGLLWGKQMQELPGQSKRMLIMVAINTAQLWSLVFLFFSSLSWRTRSSGSAYPVPVLCGPRHLTGGRVSIWSRESSEVQVGGRKVAESEMPFVHIRAERSTSCETALSADHAFFSVKIVLSHRHQDTACCLMPSIQPRAYLFWWVKDVLRKHA